MKFIVVLKDRVAETFMVPFVVPGVGLALRSLKDEIRRGGDGNVLASHPGDFVLYRIGSFDEATGVITPEDPSVVIEVANLVENGDV